MMIEIGSFLDRMLSIATATDQIVIFPAGRNELFGDEDIIMDASSAQAIIESFEKCGNNIPVDWEHSTHYQAAEGKESIAAGWITSMHWDETRGLMGTVEWGAKARQQIKAKEYKYLSPHFRIDTETRRVDHVMAVALTNTPKISNMAELVAASVAASNRSESISGAIEMDKKLKKRLIASLKLEEDATDKQIADAVEVVAAEHPVPDPNNPGEVVEGEAEVSPEDQAVIAVKSMLMDLQRMLMEANVITPEASLSDAVQAAMDLIGKTNEEPTEAAASIASALGMSGKPSTAEMVASIQERTAHMVPASVLKDVQEQVASLTAERTERKATEIVGSLIECGKLNPHDEKNMKWARDLAKTDPDRLASLMEDAPALYKSGRVTPDDGAIKTNRETVIASAMQDHGNEKVASGAVAYVNMILDDEGLEHLNNDEKKAHSIA